MSNPLEGTYRLYVWEVGGSSEEPTATDRTGSLADLMTEGQAAAASRGLEVDGRHIEMAGFIVMPEPASS